MKKLWLIVLLVAVPCMAAVELEGLYTPDQATLRLGTEVKPWLAVGFAMKGAVGGKTETEVVTNSSIEYRGCRWWRRPKVVETQETRQKPDNGFEWKDTRLGAYCKIQPIEGLLQPYAGYQGLVLNADSDGWEHGPIAGLAVNLNPSIAAVVEAQYLICTGPCELNGDDGMVYSAGLKLTF